MQQTQHSDGTPSNQKVGTAQTQGLPLLVLVMISRDVQAAVTNKKGQCIVSKEPKF